ncbi:hypothetical protein FOA43_002029 [Brettanomyces nanus]|uniref:DNA replication regulator SLD2 n=1 Tax=Eeniella nana TaxID=13502 RepID=A0A875RZV6_EENNA|nr:uncharacterized protein FOA43_002029 [Brettanomyces nanus]QPG74696.1 hypothetical protein FOA43_002029 [Brettanomyces nanus]
MASMASVHDGARDKLDNYLKSLKGEIKTWEIQNDGKTLSWNIIEAKNPNMARKYKKYAKLKRLLKKSDSGDVDLEAVFHKWGESYKSEKREKGHKHRHGQKQKQKQKHSRGVPMTPTRQIKSIEKEEKVELTEDVEDDPIKGAGDSEIDELGPTPQLNGRVLGIFDIQLRQQQSPVDDSPTKKVTVMSPKAESGISSSFKTPTKIEKPSMFRTPINSCRKRLQFEAKMDETPQYLREVAQKVSILDYDGILSDLSDFSDVESDSDLSDDSNVNSMKYDSSENPHVSPATQRLIEPSPIIRKHYKKSLYAMNEELKGLKNSLEKWREESIQEDSGFGGELEPKKEEILEEVVVPVDRIAKYRNKVKTIKRTTRRVKMKTQGPENVEDELEGEDLQQKMKELANAGNRVKEKEVEQEDNDEKDEDEENTPQEVYVRKRIRTPPKKRKVNPLSTNFVRLKINQHHGGWKRRRQ